LDTASLNYDAFKGEQFALAADGKEQKGQKERPSFRSGTMDKQSFVSSKSVDDANRYMVCVIHDKEFHLTPLKGEPIEPKVAY
jgi:DNA-directed RNA polymerase-3 subunit RPC5